MININSKHSNIIISIYIDFDCEFFIINRQYLTFQILNYIIHMLRKSKSLKIKNIKLSILNINKYFSINFVIFDKIDDKLITICFIRYLYIINNFKINILFNNNIFDLKNIVVYIKQQKLTIDNCKNFFISLKIIIKNNNSEHVKRIIRSKINITISIYFCFVVFIKYCESQLSNRNIMFNFSDIKKLNQKNNMFFHIVDANFFIVQIKNAISKSIFIYKNKQLNILIDYKENDCYLINLEICYLAADFWIKKILKIDITTLIVFQNIAFIILSTFILVTSIAIVSKIC